MTPSRTWTGSCGIGARIHLCFCVNRSSRVSDLFARPPFLSTVCSRYSEVCQLTQAMHCVFQLGSVWDSQRHLVDRASRWAAVGSTGWDKSFGFRFALLMMHLYLLNTLSILLSNPSTPIFSMTWKSRSEVSGSVFQGYGVWLDGWILPFGQKQIKHKTWELKTRLGLSNLVV